MWHACQSASSSSLNSACFLFFPWTTGISFSVKLEREGKPPLAPAAPPPSAQKPVFGRAGGGGGSGVGKKEKPTAEPSAPKPSLKKQLMKVNYGCFKLGLDGMRACVKGEDPLDSP